MSTSAPADLSSDAPNSASPSPTAPERLDFDPAAELAEVRTRRAMSQRRRWSQRRRSQLADHRAELVALRRAGGSYPDLVTWLRGRKVVVSHTTVMRYLRTLPEMSAEPEGNCGSGGPQERA